MWVRVGVWGRVRAAGVQCVALPMPLICGVWASLCTLFCAGRIPSWYSRWWALVVWVLVRGWGVVLALVLVVVQLNFSATTTPPLRLMTRARECITGSYSCSGGFACTTRCPPYASHTHPNPLRSPPCTCVCWRDCCRRIQRCAGVWALSQRRWRRGN
ncbi:hypothetical protein B484DRAFT_421225, partial [Ochromonadaceae sp. CCMP2298]